MPAPSTLQAWVLASRPATLAAAVVPVLLGSASAYRSGGFLWAGFLAALLGAIWIQIGTNFANDVFDFEKGADTAERLGPQRAVQSGLLSAAAMRRGLVLSFAVATLLGCYLVWLRGWPIVVIGVVSILSGIAYTGGPFPLGYNGLGDLFVFVFFGPVAVAGTAFVHLGRVPELAWWVSLPAACLATAILVVNNLRDRHGDRQAGKRTLAVRLGRRGTQLEYLVLVVVAFAAPIAIWQRGLAGPAVGLPLLSAPLALYLIRELFQRQGRDLNPILASTAKLLLLFGFLLTAGLVGDTVF